MRHMNDRERIVFSLLLCLLRNGSISRLVNGQCSYGTLCGLIHQLEEHMFVKRCENNTWQLLQKGEAFVAGYIKKNRVKGLYKYLSIDASALRMQRWDFDDPYIPPTTF